MTLQQIVDNEGFNVVVKWAKSQAEPIKVLCEFNVLTYYVEGVQSGYKYTERKDRSGFEIVQSKSGQLEAKQSELANEPRV